MVWFRRLIVDTLVAFGIMKVIEAGLSTKQAKSLGQRIKQRWADRKLSKWQRMIRDGQL